MSREMDTLIAEKLFGWRLLTPEESAILMKFAVQERYWFAQISEPFTVMLSPDGDIRHPRRYTSEIEAAFMVAEQIAECVHHNCVHADVSYLVLSQNSTFESVRGRWAASFYAQVGDIGEWWDETVLPYTAHAETPAEAICKAAVEVIHHGLTSPLTPKAARRISPPRSFTTP